MGDCLVVTHSGARTTLTLKRPERVDALDAALDELLLATLAATTRDGTHRILFRGTCCGAARSLLTTSRVFDAAEAPTIGFLTAIAEPSEWSEITERTTDDASVLPLASLSHMLLLARTDTGMQELAELVASISEPGLKRRIATYLA